ncbi:hypothetical protein Tco_0037428, partial [Tanacetum coccineum]
YTQHNHKNVSTATKLKIKKPNTDHDTHEYMTDGVATVLVATDLIANVLVGRVLIEGWFGTYSYERWCCSCGDDGWCWAAEKRSKEEIPEVITERMCSLGLIAHK